RLLGCTNILFLYFSLKLAISSFTVVIRRSRWITSLGTYQGAQVMRRNTLDGNLCRISIFEFEADPHNWIPYVQTGLRITLYNRSLLARESLEFLPISQYIFLSFRPSCRRFVKMGFCHVSLLSKCIPRYFAFSDCGRGWLLRNTGGQVSLLMVNVT